MKLADDLHAAIKAQAIKEDRPIATVIRRAFYLYSQRPFQEAERDQVPQEWKDGALFGVNK